MLDDELVVVLDDEVDVMLDDELVVVLDDELVVVLDVVVDDVCDVVVDDVVDEVVVVDDVYDVVVVVDDVYDVVVVEEHVVVLVLVVVVVVEYLIFSSSVSPRCSFLAKKTDIFLSINSNELYKIPVLLSCTETALQLSVSKHLFIILLKQSFGVTDSLQWCVWFL